MALLIAAFGQTAETHAANESPWAKHPENVWIKQIKVQGRGKPGKDGKPGRPYDAAVVIEFADQAAADRYIDHPAHLEWNKTYLAIREESTSHQITN